MQTANLTQLIEGMRDATNQWFIRKVIEPLYDRETSTALNAAGLVIHGASSTKAKTGGSDFYALANGIPQKIAASTDMPVLVGSVANAAFNVFCFFIDQAGVVTSQIGLAGTTLATMKFPQFPKQKALVGFILINPTGTGPFVGGTTNLDDATVAPGAVYFSPQGAFDPYCLIGGS